MIPLPPVFTEWPLAHRALHGGGRPENSLSAIRAAIEAGYGIEVDVQPSSDGVAMVFHDDVLDRLTAETGPIAERTSAELAAIPLLGGDGEGIPTLAEVLDVVAARVPLLIEIKDQDGGLGPNVGALEKDVATALEGYDGPLALMSFNPHSVAEVARLAPHLPRGLVTCDFNSMLWPEVPEAARPGLIAMDMLEQVGAGFISHDVNDLTSEPVAKVKAQGLPVLCWTVRSAEVETKARQVADNVTFEGYLP